MLLSISLSLSRIEDSLQQWRLVFSLKGSYVAVGFSFEFNF